MCTSWVSHRKPERPGRMDDGNMDVYVLPPLLGRQGQEEIARYARAKVVHVVVRVSWEGRHLIPGRGRGRRRYRARVTGAVRGQSVPAQKVGIWKRNVRASSAYERVRVPVPLPPEIIIIRHGCVGAVVSSSFFFPLPDGWPEAAGLMIFVLLMIVVRVLQYTSALYARREEPALELRA